MKSNWQSWLMKERTYTPCYGGYRVTPEPVSQRPIAFTAG